MRVGVKHEPPAQLGQIVEYVVQGERVHFAHRVLISGKHVGYVSVGIGRHEAGLTAEPRSMFERVVLDQFPPNYERDGVSLHRTILLLNSQPLAR